MSPEGLLVVDKPTGMTSHDVVARVRRALGERRVGHAGTLDPDASGVLVLGIGRATRLLGHLSASAKDYRATVRLGVATTTDDASGDVVSAAESLAGVVDATVDDAMALLTGRIAQRPSSVSAVKVDGRRAHARVRAGEEVVLPEREVDVDSFTRGPLRPGVDEAGRPVVDVDVAVTCSAGTYVRALARDLGESLGVGGHLTALRRTRAGAFGEEEAVGLESVTPATTLLTLADAACRSLGCAEVDAATVALVHHGVRIPWPAGASVEGVVGLVHDGVLLALASADTSVDPPTARYAAVLT